MAQVDTSIYGRLNTTPPDPFSTVNNLLAIQGARLHNQLTGQEIQSNQTVGQAYQSALDPTTGQVDTSKLPAAIAGSGATYGLPDAFGTALDFQRKAADLDTAQSQQSDASLGNYSNRAGTIDGALYPLLNDPNLSYGKVVGAAHNVFASNAKTMQPGDLSGFLSLIPRGPDGGPPTADQLRTAIQQYHVRSLSPAEQTTTQNPRPEALGTGDATTFVDTNPITNRGVVGTTLQQNPGPGLVEGPTINGQPTRITTKQAQDLATGRAVMGQDGTVSYPPTGGSTARSSTRAPVLTDAQGRSLDPATGQPATVPSVPSMPGAGHALPVGAPLGSDADAAQQVSQANAFQALANGSADRKAALGNLESDLQNFTSGPGTNWKGVAGAWANRNVLPANLQFNPQGIASQEASTSRRPSSRNSSSRPSAVRAATPSSAARRIPTRTWT